MIYKEVAIVMVDYENYRTDMEWENAIIKKVRSHTALFYWFFWVWM